MGGLANDLANKIISNRLIFCLRVKDIRLISRGKHLSMLLQNVQRIHLLQVEQRRIRRSACKKLYASRIIYDLVKPRKYVFVRVEVLVVRGCRPE